MARARTVLCMAAQMMRRVLVDAARARGSQKRGGSVMTVNIDDAAVLCPAPDRSILALDEALTAFCASRRAQARVVELRYFGGLTERGNRERADISPRTVRRDWSSRECGWGGNWPHSSGRPAWSPERLRQIEELFHAYGGVRRAARRHCWRERTLNCAAKSNRCWADNRESVSGSAAVEAGGQFRRIRRARCSRLGHSPAHTASKASSARAAWARCMPRARYAAEARRRGESPAARTFARDTDRRARFRGKRSSWPRWNHPHIAAALRSPEGESGDLTALVLELGRGTRRSRIA